jgi:hypothetical protein
LPVRGKVKPWRCGPDKKALKKDGEKPEKRWAKAPDIHG